MIGRVHGLVKDSSFIVGVRASPQPTAIFEADALFYLVSPYFLSAGIS